MDILWVVVLLIVWFSFMGFVGALILLDSRTEERRGRRTSKKLEKNVNKILGELKKNKELDKHKVTMEELENLSDNNEDEEDEDEEEEDNEEDYE